MPEANPSRCKRGKGFQAQVRLALTGMSLQLASLVWPLNLAMAATSQSQEKTAKGIPEEYESVSGHGLAFNNMGAAATGGITSVRTNPAMISLEKQYSVSAGYHWPSVGREYYNGGVVDSNTSSVAAGLSYTGFMDPYQLPGQSGNVDGLDSPVLKRVVLALGKSYKSIAVGASGQFVEGHQMFSQEENSTVKGTTFGLGVAVLASSNLRVGLSGENLANRKVAAYSPRTMRAGASYIFANGAASLHGDYRNREPVKDFEGCEAGLSSINACQGRKGQLQSEQTGAISASVTVYDVFRVLVSGAREWPAEVNQLAGGVALVHDSYSFSYLVQNPDLSKSALHQALNLSIGLSM